MAINKRTKQFMSIILISGVIFTSILTNDHHRGTSKYNADCIISSDVCDEKILIDKVVIFYAPFYTIQYDNLALIGEYNYITLIEIVTPHNCMLNLTLIDPAGDHYDVFKTSVNISQDDSWFEIPFGTVITGNYSFVFSPHQHLSPP